MTKIWRRHGMLRVEPEPAPHPGTTGLAPFGTLATTTSKARYRQWITASPGKTLEQLDRFARQTGSCHTLAPRPPLPK